MFYMYRYSMFIQVYSTKKHWDSYCKFSKCFLWKSSLLPTDLWSLKSVREDVDDDILIDPSKKKLCSRVVIKKMETSSVVAATNHFLVVGRGSRPHWMSPGTSCQRYIFGRVLFTGAPLTSTYLGLQLKTASAGWSAWAGYVDLKNHPGNQSAWKTGREWHT